MRSTPKRRCRGVGLIAAALGAVLILGASGCTVEETLNPCGANTNPCAENPCNPCGANPCNPCGANPCNPCAANPCNPCAANPCNPCGGGGAKASDFTQPEGQRIAKATPALVSRGEELWNDKSLSSNGLACQTCHVGGSQMNASFAKPYPHRVAMVHQQSGVPEVNAAEMIQFCMLTPMASDAWAWNSVELAALTAYVGELQKDFVPSAAAQANPCNPCGAKGNPCAPKNPCSP